MSSSAKNADLESMSTVATPGLAALPRPLIRPAAAGREALQALLAFSALHEQVKQRRAREHRNGDGSLGDVGELEQFVLDEVLQLVAERALAMTGSDGVAIALAEDQAIICRGSAGKIAPDAGARLDPHSGFSGACLASGQVVRCDDSETDLRVDPFACRNLGARSMVAVPLLAKDTVIGLVEAFSVEPYGFSDDDVRSLRLLAELILAALKPEEEDRLAEISQRVVGRTAPPLTPEISAVPARATTEDAEEFDLEIQTIPAPNSVPKNESLEHTRPGLVVVLVLVLFAVGLGAGLWWSIWRHTATAVIRPQPTETAPPTNSQPLATKAALSAPESDGAPESKSDPSLPAPEPTGSHAAVTGIRHWSSPDSSTVVIDLQDQVQYEAHRLANPERIYFDLFDTRLAEGLSGKKIDVGDELLQRVRVAQPVHGVTRVVLETKGNSNFAVSMEINPYRLVVEIRRVGAPPAQRTKVDLFGPPETSPAETSLAAPEAAHIEAAPIVPRLRIALDAGHGGWDLGTVGREGLLEKDLALDIVRRAGKLVESRLGAEVIYTRKDDDYIPLEKRAEIANVAQADLFLSVHANYSDSTSARGVETYYTDTYSSLKARSAEDEADPALQNIDWNHVDIREKVRGSHRFAVEVQRSLYSTLAAKNPDLPNRGVKEAHYVVLTGTAMPAILAEVSFVSSPTDENNLRNPAYRQKIAEALYQGISHYAQESSHTKLASASLKTIGR
jgi:N-acetylmuramoyl-L-alanine amidase/GAF domain-containing protein